LYRRILIVAVAGSIGLAACGGSSDKKADGAIATTTSSTAAPTTTTLAPITKAAYIEQANAICKVMNDKSDALPDPGEDVAKVLSMFEQGRAITADALTQLRALRLPAGEEAAIDAVWDKADVMLADVDQAIAALKSGDLQQFVTITNRLETTGKAANDASTAYGLTVCGEE
jgi:hypothetical protein